MLHPVACAVVRGIIVSSRLVPGATTPCVATATPDPERKSSRARARSPTSHTLFRSQEFSQSAHAVLDQSALPTPSSDMSASGSSSVTSFGRAGGHRRKQQASSRVRAQQCPEYVNNWIKDFSVTQGDQDTARPFFDLGQTLSLLLVASANQADRERRGVCRRGAELCGPRQQQNIPIPKPVVPLYLALALECRTTNLLTNLKKRTTASPCDHSGHFG